MFELEGPIYGLSLIWRDLERVILRGHRINALYLQKDFVEDIKTALPTVEKLVVSSSTWPTLGCFPNLTDLDIDGYGYIYTKDFLCSLWKLSLKSFKLAGDLDDQAVETHMTDCEPPAFAQTLHTFQFNNRNLRPLDILSQYCRNLTDLTLREHHLPLLENNTHLTSLSLGERFPSSDPFDLSQYTDLVQLNLTGIQFFSRATTHPKLEYVLLNCPDIDSATQFLAQCPAQCPALRQISLCCDDWDHIVQLTRVLDANKCPQLTLSLPRYVRHPCFLEVEELLLRRGFLINEDFLLTLSDAKQCWGRIMQVAPNITKWRRLHQDDWGIDQFLQPHSKNNNDDEDGGHPFPFSFSPSCQPFFASFSNLSVIDFDTDLQPWNQEMLKSLVDSCLSLKELTLYGPRFLGTLQLQSQSLRKVSLHFKAGFSGFDLRLPNLTHLTLRLTSGYASFFQGLLGGEDKRQSWAVSLTLELPLLRVLSLSLERSNSEVDYSVPCTMGHGELTQLIIDGHFSASSFILRNLPRLRQAKFSFFSASAIAVVNVPGDCDLWIGSGLSRFERKGCSDQSNFMAEIIFDEDLGWTSKRSNPLVALDRTMSI